MRAPRGEAHFDIGAKLRAIVFQLEHQDAERLPGESGGRFQRAEGVENFGVVVGMPATFTQTAGRLGETYRASSLDERLEQRGAVGQNKEFPVLPGELAVLVELDQKFDAGLAIRGIEWSKAVDADMERTQAVLDL